MAILRKVEIFTAGCPICDETVQLVQHIACESCDVDVLDLNDQKVAQRAEALGIRSLPAVVVDGTLARCCAGRGITEEALRAEGIGQPLSPSA